MKNKFVILGVLSLMSTQLMSKTINFEFEHIAKPYIGYLIQLKINAYKGGDIQPSHSTGDCWMKPGHTCKATTESSFWAPDPTGIYTFEITCDEYSYCPLPCNEHTVTRKIGMNVTKDVKLKVACPIDNNGHLLPPALIR